MERVLVVADDPLVRAGLATLLADEAECMVVGQVSSNAGLTAMFDLYHPDVVVWDLGWDPETALEQLSSLKGEAPPVIALIPDERYVTDVWVAGAQGCLRRDASAGSLAAAIVAVAQGLVTLDASLAAALLPTPDRVPMRLVEELTPRELEVLQLLAEGLPNKTIARRLGISEHTVKFHVNSILGKLGAQSRTEAVVRATRLGLILL